MKILFISNLFPDRKDPVRGLDNALILHALCDDLGHEVRVISPRAVLFPGFARRRSIRTPRLVDEPLAPIYPGAGYVPKIGSRWNDRLMERALRPQFDTLAETWSPDVILASWLYPDGCAVSNLSDHLRIPVVLITQGSDTHQYLADPVRRSKIVRSANKAAYIICRSGDLKRRLSEAGIPKKKLQVIYNGVDPDLFRPLPQKPAREQLGIDTQSPILLFVGNLLPVKNVSFLLRALALLNERRRKSKKNPAKLQVIGQGPLEARLRSEAKKLLVENDVDFLGRRGSDEVALRMIASDVFCLTSRNEGFPNVLLEAMACRLPIVSTDVGGISEKIDSPVLGKLVQEGCLESYVEALEEYLAKESPANGDVFSNDASWHSTARQYEQLLKSARTLSHCKSGATS